MNRQAIIQFLDAYRDGIIDERAARELATAIRQGGPTTDWVLQELALSGWISQALDTLDERTFVHCFLVRLYAERSGDDFSKAFNEKVAATRVDSPSGRGAAVPQRVPLLGWLFGGVRAASSAARQRPARRPRPRRWAAAVVAAAVALALFAVLSRPAPRPAAGTLLSATPGTRILSNEERTAQSGMTLWSNDRVTVPLDGLAVIRAGNDHRFELRAGAVATLMPLQFGATPAGYPPETTILLESGELTAEHTAGSESHPVLVATPHANATSNGMSRFIVTVTGASCHVAVDAGTVLLTRRRDGRTIQVTAGYSALATDAESFELTPQGAR